MNKNFVKKWAWGRTATQRSKKGSEKVLGRLLGKGSQKGSEKGSQKGVNPEGT